MKVPKKELIETLEKEKTKFKIENKEIDFGIIKIPLHIYYCDDLKFQEDKLFFNHYERIIKSLPYMTSNVSSVEIFIHYKYKTRITFVEFDVLIKINHLNYTKLIAIELKEYDIDKVIEQIIDRLYYVDYGVVISYISEYSLYLSIGKILKRNEGYYQRYLSKVLVYWVHRYYENGNLKEELELIKGTGEGEIYRLASYIARNPRIKEIVDSFKRDLEVLKERFFYFYDMMINTLGEIEDYRTNLDLFLKKDKQGDAK